MRTMNVIRKAMCRPVRSLLGWPSSASRWLVKGVCDVWRECNERQDLHSDSSTIDVSSFCGSRSLGVYISVMSVNTILMKVGKPEVYRLRLHYQNRRAWKRSASLDQHSILYMQGHEEVGLPAVSKLSDLRSWRRWEGWQMLAHVWTLLKSNISPSASDDIREPS